MSDEYFVRWFEEGDLTAFIDGLNVDLWDEYDEDVFNWKFRENPFDLGFTSIAVVEHSPTGIPVAFNSFLPLEVRSGDGVFMSVQGCDGFVDRGHRRRGLFQRTLAFLSEEMRGRVPEVLIGFNLLEAAGAAHKAGSELAYDLDKCKIESGALGGLPARRDLELTPIGVERLHELYEGWATGSRVLHFHRSLPFLRWRVHGHPVRKSRPFEVLLDGGSRGYVVIDLMEEQGGLTMTLNDYTPGLLGGLLQETLAALLEMNPEVTTVELNASGRSRLESLAVGMGFEVLPWYTVIMMALNNTRQEGRAVYRGDVKLSDHQLWHVTNSDIF